MSQLIDHRAEAPPYQQIAAALRERIACGTYRPGPPLPAQSALAAEFGVSVITIAKAMRVLAGEGLIRVVPRRGSYVAA